MSDAFFPETSNIEGVDFIKLRGWMDGKNIGAGPIIDVAPLTGGTQNIMVRFERNGEQYVLRRPPIHKRRNSDKTMLREARVLGALGGAGVPHPRLIAACADTWVTDSTFYLASYVDGFNPTVIQPDFHMDTPDIAHRMALSHIEAIAALGNVDWVKQGLHDFGKPDGWLARQVPRWRSHWEGYLETPEYSAEELVGVGTIGAWLERRMPEQGKPGIVHGDCHLANTLFEWETPELAALVDWELATIGDPLLDLGWVLATSHDPDDVDRDSDGLTAPQLSQKFASADQMIAHYAQTSGRPVDHAWWYGVLACYKLAIIIEGTYVRFLEGKVSEETGTFLHELAIGLFNRAERFMLKQS